MILLIVSLTKRLNKSSLLENRKVLHEIFNRANCFDRSLLTVVLRHKCFSKKSQ